MSIFRNSGTNNSIVSNSSELKIKTINPKEL